ncbi:MAG: glycosyltransferase family 2 protein [Bacteroidetes bacterium]|nr:glycosyltransferase family 2 protein [Bacteroidota bacterium]
MESLLTIVIPSYNEEQSLKHLLPTVLAFSKKHNFSLVVVNDGSTDASKLVLDAFLLDYPIFRVIHHKVNRGYGGAIKSGIEACASKYVITIDADGQHNLEDIEKMVSVLKSTDADMVVGNRAGGYNHRFRETGKWIIRKTAKFLMPLHIKDLNSGMKLYSVPMAKKYLHLCPNSMAYSDIITLIFISQKHLVVETPITINQRMAGKSTIGIKTAFDTIMEILNIVMLFNPMRIFLTLSVLIALLSLAWEIPIFLRGNGLSVGALLGFTVSIFLFLLGLIAEQLGLLRRLVINKD